MACHGDPARPFSCTRHQTRLEGDAARGEPLTTVELCRIFSAPVSSPWGEGSELIATDDAGDTTQHDPRWYASSTRIRSSPSARRSRGLGRRRGRREGPDKEAPPIEMTASRQSPRRSTDSTGAAPGSCPATHGDTTVAWISCIAFVCLARGRRRITPACRRARAPSGASDCFFDTDSYGGRTTFFTGCP